MTTLALLLSAVERVIQFFPDEIALSWGVTRDVLDGVEQLKSDLRLIVEFSSDADLMKNISAEVNRQVRESAYDIEDAVESFVRRQESAASSKWKSGGGALSCLIKHYCSRERSFLEDLHVFRRRTRELIDLMAGARGSSSTAADNVPSAEPEPPLHNPQQFHEKRASVLVGMDDNRVSLMNLLRGGGSRLSIIAICGMGGIGKTTLARSLYNDTSLVEYFDYRVWATVGTEFQARDILETILFSLSSYRTKDEIAAMETMELTERLYKTLKGRRYFFVLDDVWSTEAWDTLRFTFPDDCNGSRIVITTRLMDVAKYTSRSVLQLRTLTENQSWELFLMKSGLHEDILGTQLNPQMAEIGKQIVTLCRGLPLAVTLIGSMLLGKNLKDWEAVLHSLQGDLLSEAPRDLEILDLSYAHLSFRLKPCFLYLGHFPPDQAIPVDKLLLLWMAEGLMISNRMEVAEDYFNELVDRNLVIVVEKEDWLATRRFLSCRVHDLLRDLCISKGKQEEFFEVIDFEHANEISSSTCRLAIYLYKFKDTNDALLNIPEAKRIRSILFFDTVQYLANPTWPREVSDLTEFQRTRVLDFDGVDFQVKKLPRGIEKLIYLRHLSFRGCYLQEFPSSFSKFPFLETLDLRVSCLMTIPNVLRKLPSLRHLYFPLAYRSDGKDKLKLDSLKKLEVLENFHADICDAEDLLQLENLQILTGTVNGNNLDLKNSINSIKKMKSVRRSSLVVQSFDCYSKERILIVEELLECNAILALDIEGYMGALPLRDIVIGSKFTEMVFNGSEFSEDPMPILGKLPNLKSLVLCNDAFAGTKLVCGESDFSQLTTLKLATLQYLEKWEVEGHILMPILTILTIEQCDKLEMLPSELTEIPTLQKLMIGSMAKKFQDEVTEMVQERTASGLPELTVTFYDC